MKNQKPTYREMVVAFAQARKDRIVDLLLQGNDYAAVAKILGISKARVSQICPRDEFNRIVRLRLGNLK